MQQPRDIMAGAFRRFAWGSFRARPQAQTPEPIVHTVKISKPDSHAAEVEAVFPTAGRPPIEIMMAVWSPGFYRVEDYAKAGRGSLGQSA